MVLRDPERSSWDLYPSPVGLAQRSQESYRALIVWTNTNMTRSCSTSDIICAPSGAIFTIDCTYQSHSFAPACQDAGRKYRRLRHHCLGPCRYEGVHSTPLHRYSHSGMGGPAHTPLEAWIVWMKNDCCAFATRVQGWVEIPGVFPGEYLFPQSAPSPWASIWRPGPSPCCIIALCPTPVSSKFRGF